MVSSSFGTDYAEDDPGHQVAPDSKESIKDNFDKITLQMTTQNGVISNGWRAKLDKIRGKDGKCVYQEKLKLQWIDDNQVG